MHPSTPPHPLSPSFNDESPSLFLRLINKMSHLTKTLALVGVAMQTMQLCVFVCLFVWLINLSVSVIAALCQCWWWVCSSLLQSSCCTSGGSTPALKPHLMTSDPAPQLLNTLDLDQTTNGQQPYCHIPLPHYHYNMHRHTNWIFMWPSQLMISICSGIDAFLVGSTPPLSEGSGQGDREEVMQMWCLYMMSDMCLWVYAALLLSSGSMSLLLPHHGLVLEDVVFWPLQTFLPLTWIAFFVNSLCTKCYCNIVQ